MKTINHSGLNSHDEALGVENIAPIRTTSDTPLHFDTLDIDGNFHIFLHPLAQSDQILPSPQNNIELTCLDNTLHIHSTHKHTLDLHIHCKGLTALRTSGNVTVDTLQPIKGSDIEISASGRLDGHIEIQTESLSTHISGTADLKLSGSAHEHNLSVEGAAQIDATSLTTQCADVIADGPSKILLHAQEEAKISSYRLAEVLLKGKPNAFEEIAHLPAEFILEEVI